MALDHSRLGLENKLLETKSGEFFAFDKFTLQDLANKSGDVETNLLDFLRHHIWGETVPWGAVFIIQPSDRMQYFTILQYKLHSFNKRQSRRFKLRLIELYAST